MENSNNKQYLIATICLDKRKSLSGFTGKLDPFYIFRCEMTLVCKNFKHGLFQSIEFFQRSDFLKEANEVEKA